MVCAYDPVGYGIPYNHLLFSDQREQLVEQAVQILIVSLEHEGGSAASAALRALDSCGSPSGGEEQEVRGSVVTRKALALSRRFSNPLLSVLQPAGPDNLFVNYLSRIHREEVR